MTITIHRDLEQGSDEWHALRCGILTASEMKFALTMTGGGKVTKYRHAPKWDTEGLTAKRSEALGAVSNRTGSIKDLALIAGVSDGVIRALVASGHLEKFEDEIPVKFSPPPEDKMLSHVWELAAQRISKYVEPSYIGDDMLRGWEDEILAREKYEVATGYAIEEVGFITNDKWGFTIGYSPDALAGDDGLLECKSRRQKYQVQTIVEWHRTGAVPTDYAIQLQTGLMVSEREWIDLVSYSGGLHMPIMRVQRDEKVIAAIEEAATSFDEKVRSAVFDYEDATVGMVLTERKVEQEMHV